MYRFQDAEAGNAHVFYDHTLSVAGMRYRPQRTAFDRSKEEQAKAICSRLKPLVQTANESSVRFAVATAARRFDDNRVALLQVHRSCSRKRFL